MGFYEWRPKISLAAAQEGRRAAREQTDSENLIGRWREAMARERENRIAWSIQPELIPVRVAGDRPRR